MTYQVQVAGKTRRYEAGISYEQIAEEFAGRVPHQVILVFANGHLRELSRTLREDTELRFVTTAEKIGAETYRRSCEMLFLAAADAVCEAKKSKTVLHFSVGDGLFFTLEGCGTPDEALIGRIEEKMRELVRADLPIRKRSLPTYEARALFRKYGMEDKDKLFRSRIASRVNLYTLGTYEDYYYGYMAPRTGILRYFRLYPYRDGIVLQMPDRTDPEHLTRFTPSDKLFDTQRSSGNWADQMEIGSVGDLNERVIRQEMRQTILLSEALQESRIAEIAEKIAERKDVRFVMIAGPSSSGKTTFSQRLSVQLNAHGRKTHYFGVDNYYRDRDEVPLTPEGKKDYESLGAIDVDRFNADMTALLKGETIHPPVYDFISGTSRASEACIKLGENELLVIEGIHCLNDALSDSLPKESKFRIYISALTQLNVDEHNRIPTTDGRLIRRIVRDFRTRGCSAAGTLAMWDDVRRGEEQNIFPFQESADEMFNSALPYELGVFKLYATPMLLQVEETDPEYPEAKRLLKFLDYFVAIPSEDVPSNSILREFIGGGCYHL